MLLNDIPLNTAIADFSATTDRRRIDLEAAVALLKATHWGGKLTIETLRIASENSLTFALNDDQGTLIGFARAVTDRATFAYLTDVVVAPVLRGNGIGRQFMEWVLSHPDIQAVRRISLLTRDAAPLYQRLGFTVGSALIYMEKTP
jgi:N-acetylglutamate synthase-like GNAT family acetyltransferase